MFSHATMDVHSQRNGYHRTVLERWNKAAVGQGVAFFAISLVMPLVPNDAMCYVAGLGTISRIRFSIANLLGRGLACVIASAAGAFGGRSFVAGMGGFDRNICHRWYCLADCQK